ncbi:MAG TPA: DUF4175 family protein, partial [Gemmatimonadaceae bacterium]
AARLVFLPQPAAAEPMRRFIEVQPGDAELARGGDQLVRAQLNGFASDSVLLVLRATSDSASAGSWDRIPMVPDSGGAFSLRLFDVAAPTEYYVESDGIRSPTYRLKVTDLPFVDRIDLAYTYPAYTGLAPDSTLDGGDVAAPLGTAVRVRTTTTLPVPAGQLVIEERDTVPLAPQPDGTLAGTLTVRRPGFYRVELQGADGRMVTGSLDYTIDVIEDRPPTVRIAKPGRDSRPTTLEEVFTEARADDDYGVAKLELVYSVNGGPEQTVPLHQGRPLREVTAGHTFFLEEFGLAPGDLVSYYARATDGNRASGPQTATTDIYFMQIRPFGRDYSAAEQAGGGGGAQQSTPGSLSRQQRDVVAATFNVLRDRATLDDRTLRQNTSTVNLAQGRVREQAEELATQLVQRGVVASDTTFRTVADALRLAVGAMRQAEEALATRRPDDALPAEQRALQQLQRAEAAFRETSVARGGGGGGGGGGGQQSAEELADLFELETDKLQNQYETVQRGQQAQAQQAADSVAERLRELAERQQRENERMQQLAQRLRSQSAGGGGGGGSQRQLAQETEEAARQLERLAREQRSPELQETARSLREAADAMRRSAGNNAQNGAGAGAAALEQLRQAQRRLEEQRGQSLEERVRDAARQAGEIADRQRQLAGEAQRTATSSAAERAARGQRLGEDKEALAGQVQDLENQLAAAAREARAGQPEAARKLQDAAVGIRQNQLADKLRFSANVARGGSPEYSRNIEEQLGEELGALRDQVSAAAGAIRADEGRREDRVLERARELARALESMRARGERRGRDGQDGQDGRNGQRGLQGEQGQRGQQGQAGQQGRQGQAGREG